MLRKVTARFVKKSCLQKSLSEIKKSGFGEIALNVAHPTISSPTHAAHYRYIESLLPPVRHSKNISWPINDAKNVRGIFIDITQRCNLRCPNCLADSKSKSLADTPTIDETMKALDKLLPYKPVIYLSGGEPTLSNDLPEWLRTLSTARYDVKLLTNGLTLIDRSFCEMLIQSGARWFLLQFDSLKEEELIVLRGRKGLAKKRRKALENLSQLGANVCLACMIDRNSNLASVAETIRFGFNTPGVRHVSLMPARRIGRGSLTDDDNFLDEIELIDEIRKQTNGKIAYRDWLLFFSAMTAYYRLFGSPDFAMRRCFLPLPLVGTGNDFYPVTRIGGFVKIPRNVSAFLKMASKGGRVESANLSERSLLISIETFREPHNIDVDDAGRCSRYYLANGKFHQACIYNTIIRPNQ